MKNGPASEVRGPESGFRDVETMSLALGAISCEIIFPTGRKRADFLIDNSLAYVLG